MSNDIVFIDTETTGLVDSLGCELEHQPHMIEICIIKTDSKAKKIIGEFTTLIKPPVEIPYHVTAKVHGIDDYMVRNSPTFEKVFPKIKKIIKGAKTMVAQNLPFDKNMIEIEAERLSIKVKLPPKLFCTIEQSMHFKGFRLSSAELYDSAKGKKIKGQHRARADVLAMIKYYRKIKSGYLPEHFREVV